MHSGRFVCCQTVLGLVVLLSFAFGCGERIEPQPLSLPEARIRNFGKVYREFQTAQHKKPANLEELKTWAKKLPKTRLDELEIADIDEVFVSPRDNQPYVLKATPAGPWQVVAHEKTGMAGKRYVITAMGSALELDESAFKLIK